MAALMRSLFPKLNVFLYRISNGKMGARSSTATILLLFTKGRKTGKERTTPLRYIKHGDDFVIAASNWGQEKPPAWYFNLKADPNVTIQDLDQHIKVRAEEATPEQHAEIYPLFIQVDARFAEYPKTAKRTIPLMILHPQR